MSVTIICSEIEMYLNILSNVYAMQTDLLMSEIQSIFRVVECKGFTGSHRRWLMKEEQLVSARLSVRQEK